MPPFIPTYLLDTNICSHLLRNSPPEVGEALRKSGGFDRTAASVLTLYEMRFGAENASRPRDVHKSLDVFFGLIAVLDFDDKAAVEAAKIRHELKKQLIGPVDLLIAGHARSLGATLVTRNVKEFRRVPGLKVVAW